MKRKHIFVAGTSLLALICLAACGEDPTQTPTPQASVNTASNPDNRSESPKPVSGSASPKPTPTPLPPLAAGLIDVSGCWRSVGSDGFANGNQIDLVRTNADAFVFGGTPLRTKMVFKPDRSFSEVNYDDAHPFFPPGYIHSNGVVSEDGNSIERTLVGEESHPQSLKRCGTISDRPYVPIGAASPGPSPSVLVDGGQPSNPSVSPTPIVLPSGSPKPAASPSPKATATPTPKPTIKPTPTPTPKPTASASAAAS